MTCAQAQNHHGDAIPTDGELIGHVVTIAIAVIAMAILLVSMSRSGGRSRREVRHDVWIRIPPYGLQR
jgi:hypothetical protein